MKRNFLIIGSLLFVAIITYSIGYWNTNSGKSQLIGEEQKIVLELTNDTLQWTWPSLATTAEIWRITNESNDLIDTISYPTQTLVLPDHNNILGYGIIYKNTAHNIVHHQYLAQTEEHKSQCDLVRETISVSFDAEYIYIATKDTSLLTFPISLHTQGISIPKNELSLQDFSQVQNKVLLPYTKESTVSRTLELQTPTCPHLKKIQLSEQNSAGVMRQLLQLMSGENPSHIAVFEHIYLALHPKVESTNLKDLCIEEPITVKSNNRTNTIQGDNLQLTATAETTLTFCDQSTAVLSPGTEVLLSSADRVRIHLRNGNIHYTSPWQTGNGLGIIQSPKEILKNSFGELKISYNKTTGEGESTILRGLAFEQNYTDKEERVIQKEKAPNLASANPWDHLTLQQKKAVHFFRSLNIVTIDDQKFDIPMTYQEAKILLKGLFPSYFLPLPESFSSSPEALLSKDDLDSILHIIENIIANEALTK